MPSTMYVGQKAGKCKFFTFRYFSSKCKRQQMIAIMTLESCHLIAVYCSAKQCIRIYILFRTEANTFFT